VVIMPYSKLYYR